MFLYKPMDHYALKNSLKNTLLVPAADHYNYCNQSSLLRDTIETAGPAAAESPVGPLPTPSTPSG